MTSQSEVHVALEDEGTPLRAPPRTRHRPPQITLPIIHIQGPNSAIKIEDSGQNHIGPTCVTPGSPYVMPIPAHVLYGNKAGEFMFKQFQGFKGVAKSGLSVGEKSAFWFYNKVRELSRKWFTHAFLFLVVFGYTCLGAFTFVTFEGAHELEVKRDVWDNRVSFARELKELASDDFLRENAEEMQSRTLQAIRNYELSFYDSITHGYFPKENTNSNNDREKSNKVWTFWNAVFYCGTIYTTIGYGHISPSTTAGRALTIVYAIFGIPLFLILLADFGKLFTRGIKFLWAFVRRLYYTGSCRKVRRTVPVQEVMKGVQLVYDFATFRRPSQQYVPGIPVPPGQAASAPVTAAATPHLPVDGNAGVPSTPSPSAFEVDDEFNLPISVAIVILVIYVVIGATMFWFWEEWTFFESFYFVFISMSTIGFGDFVPNNPMYMMASIIYLVFGLALTSMCINVVQEKLSDSFRQASAKLGATIGLRMAEEGGMIPPQVPPNEPAPEEAVQHPPSIPKSATN